MSTQQERQKDQLQRTVLNTCLKNVLNFIFSKSKLNKLV